MTTSVDTFYKRQIDGMAMDVKMSKKAESAMPELGGLTIEAWRYNRLHQKVMPLLDNDPNSSWLTVGDGRYGCDAAFLLNYTPHVHASDIQDQTLAAACASSIIKEYSAQNAERLTFPHDSFDYVYCKESYHHFPRPMIALYEMLRVARKGVVLTEPQDISWSGNPFRLIASKVLVWIKKFLRPQSVLASLYEESGNYVFTVSRRELEKVCMGLNLWGYSYRVDHDCFVPESVESDQRKRLKRVKNGIHLRTFFYKIGIYSNGLLTAVIHKTAPNATMIQGLRNAGFRVCQLPRNPYSGND
jgi:ubiquinone/menaquinone biosynthesis C-methylase UbiE